MPEQLFCEPPQERWVREWPVGYPCIWLIAASDVLDAKNDSVAS